MDPRWGLRRPPTHTHTGSGRSGLWAHHWGGSPFPPLPLVRLLPAASPPPSPWWASAHVGGNLNTEGFWGL